MNNLKSKSKKIQEEVKNSPNSSFIRKLKWGKHSNLKENKPGHENPPSLRKTKLHKQTQREKSIDYMRTFSVLLMIITHVIAIVFDHQNNSSRVVYYIGLIGGTISFTSFLLLSGISLRISYEKNNNNLKKFRQKTIFRIIEILIVYYMMAIISFKVNSGGFSIPIDQNWIKDIISILVFYKVPEFTEFLISIAGFYILFIVFTNAFIYINKKFIFVVIASVISYLLGYLLYQVDLNNKILITAKALLAGHENLHTFPILQYLPVFLIGTWIGTILLRNLLIRERLEVLVCIIIALTLISTIFLQLHQLFNWQVVHFSLYSTRFPPSLGFIFVSLTASLSILLLFLIFEYIYKKFNTKAISIGLDFIGLNALDFLFLHTFVLLAFKYGNERFNKTDWKYSNLHEIILIYLIVLLISAIYVLLKKSLKKICSKDSNTYWLFSSRFMIFIMLTSAIGSITISAAEGTIDSYKDKIILGTNLEKELDIQNYSDLWWDYNYKNRQRIEVDPTANVDTLEININHQKLLENLKVVGKNGEDIKIVAQRNADNFFDERQIIFENLQSENLKIFFQPFKDATVSHYIYYGNPSQTVATPGFNYNPEKNFSQLSNIADIEESNIIIKTNRKWFLKGIDTTLDLNVSINESGGEILSAYYNISGLQDFNSELTSSIENSFSGRLDLIDFAPGKYDLEITLITLSDKLQVYTSRKIPIYVSYPLYVSWTIDWEGWDVSDLELNDISSISDKYIMPITHFFNPRFFIKNQYSVWAVSASRVDYLTNWVKNRKINNGDEIGLHLHLYEDLLKEIGVTPMDDKKIIGIERNETQLSAYSLPDLEKIFKWSVEMFKAKGLGQPVTFRSGAWLSSVNVLQAAYNSGIKVDSSGRTGGYLNPWNSQSTQIPWNLGVKVKPYLPSYSNINAWYGERIGIWEFPNNGADSYWFSLEQLKNRFDENYSDKNSVLDAAQSVVYLSHPHGFTVTDSVKIRGLLEYTGKYKFSNDEGPVIYSTLEQSYNRWDKSLINGE